MVDYVYCIVVGLGEDQLIEIYLVCFISINYGVIMYMKIGLVFNYLK